MPAYTEQQIRGLAVNFLRLHYKLRPRYAGTGTRVVSRPHFYQNVLIDARLAFQRPDRTYFTATVEATSIGTAQEVLYEVNLWRVFIHSLVLTMALMALGLWITEWWAVGRLQDHFFYRHLGASWFWTFTAGSFLLLFGSIGLALSRWRVYRYIYAVDQFKRFFANAQWIAFDEEIFASVPRRYFRELERQCIRFGFGLISIGADSQVRLLVTPSSIDQFGGERIKLPVWVANIEQRPVIQNFTKRLSLPARTTPRALPPPNEPALDEASVDPLSVGPYLSLPVSRVETDLIPADPKPGKPVVYQRSYRHLPRLRATLRRAYRSIYPGGYRRRPGFYELGTWVFVLGFPALVGFVWAVAHQASYSEVARPGQRAAAPDVALLENPNNPAPPQTEPLTGEYVPTIRPGRAEADINVAPLAIPGQDITDETRLPVRARLTADGEEFRDYSCVSAALMEREAYVLLLAEYPGFDNAYAFAREVNRRYRLPVSVELGDCLLISHPGYLVYFGTPTSDESMLNYRLRRLRYEFNLTDAEILGVNRQ